MKKFYESKTILFGVILVLTAVAGLFGYADYTPDQNTTEIVNLVVGFVTIVLRLVTKSTIE